MAAGLGTVTLHSAADATHPCAQCIFHAIMHAYNEYQQGDEYRYIVGTNIQHNSGYENGALP